MEGALPRTAAPLAAPMVAPQVPQAAPSGPITLSPEELSRILSQPDSENPEEL
jgi:hypothetical protein